jgi:hypothetical protein
MMIPEDLLLSPRTRLAPFAPERVETIEEIVGDLSLPEGRLSEDALRRLVLEVASLPRLFADLVVGDPEVRWWMTLHLEERFDLRVLSWEQNQESDWHDHGGSSGAFVVTSGSLRERSRGADHVSIAERRLLVGESATFGPSHVHDVLFESGSPAVSIHAYSPPLTGLTYYDHSPLGFVARDVIPEERRRAFELAA